MEKTRIQIVEDEAITAEDIKETLEKMGYAVNEVAYSVDMASELYDKYGADIFIVDITLKGSKTGIDLGKIIQTTYKKPFIFLTSHTDHSTLASARECSPGSYLVKPFKKEELFMAIELALKNHGGGTDEPKTTEVYRSSDSIFIKDGYNFIKVKEPDICFLKSEGVYIEVHTIGKTHLTRDTFKSILAKLSSDKFIQTHKSYYINVDHIREVNSAYVKIGEHEIPISKSHKDDVFKLLGLG